MRLPFYVETKDKPNPCPKCNHHFELMLVMSEDEHTVLIVCKNCQTRGEPKSTPKMAVDAWNTLYPNLKTPDARRKVWDK